VDERSARLELKMVQTQRKSLEEQLDTAMSELAMRSDMITDLNSRLAVAQKVKDEDSRQIRELQEAIAGRNARVREEYEVEPPEHCPPPEVVVPDDVEERVMDENAVPDVKLVLPVPKPRPPRRQNPPRRK
jgi:uncharacterized coiled-coil protein SlyX